MTAHRGTICLEDATVLTHAHFDGEQHVLRLQAARCAARATPGSFVHLRCAEELPMRRPLSIMRAEPSAGWIEVLYKGIGVGSRLLARVQPGDTLSLLGPIGRGFRVHPERPRVLAIGGGVGIPPMVFLVESLLAAGSSTPSSTSGAGYDPLVLMGSEVPFPFRLRPSTILVPGIAQGAIACMPLLDGWGIPSRLATRAGFAGCFDGYVTDLARGWLESLEPQQRQQVEIFACGPTPMLAAVARLGRDFQLPCQVALEEFMACGVGGCAGCTVAVTTPAGKAMKRVCVDGPVFDASSVFPH